METETDRLIEEALFVGVQLCCPDISGTPTGADVIWAVVKFVAHNELATLKDQALTDECAIQRPKSQLASCAADTPAQRVDRRHAIRVTADRVDLAGAVERGFPPLLPKRNQDRNWGVLLRAARGIDHGAIAATTRNERGGFLGSSQAVESIIKHAINGLALRLTPQVALAIARWRSTPLRIDVRDLPQLSQMRI